MKVLIVEDEMGTRNLLEDILREEHDTVNFSTGSSALRYLSQNQLDFVLLDRGLPDIEGHEVAKIIKSNPKVYGKPYIIMLTAKTESEDVIFGFKNGADDYIKKPFNPEELKLRITAASKNFMLIHNYYEYESIEINLDSQSVSFFGEAITLTKTEFNLLLYLIMNKGKVLTRKKIYQKVWNEIYYSGNRTIDVYIRRLKIKFPILDLNIKSINGVGYKLV